jgi:hypothetical protein
MTRDETFEKLWTPFGEFPTKHRKQKSEARGWFNAGWDAALLEAAKANCEYCDDSEIWMPPVGVGVTRYRMTHKSKSGDDMAPCKSSRIYRLREGKGE